MKIRPSSLPMLAACPCWTGDEQASEHTDAGTERHSALAKMLADPNATGAEVEDDFDLSPEDIEGVEWAFEYIKANAPLDSFPLITEQRQSFTGPNFEEISGTPDVVCGPVLFDLKWRRRDYRAQMAGYALMLLEKGWESIEVHILFAESKRADRMRFTMAEAQALVFPIIEAAVSALETPTPCEYCSWCAHKLTCKALADNVNAVISGRPDFDLQTWHSSDITDPVEMGKALRIARLVGQWCESVEHHAKEMATKQGKVPVGFKIQTRQGNRFIASITDAFARAGVPQDKFLGACEIKLSALTEIYAETNQLKKKPAERELEAKLGPVVQRKASSISLVNDSK